MTVVDKIWFFLFGVIIGGTIGFTLNSNTYLNGRLSACKDMVRSMNETLPLELKCTVSKGDVVITSPLLKGEFTLDGKPRN